MKKYVLIFAFVLLCIATGFGLLVRVRYIDAANRDLHSAEAAQQKLRERQREQAMAQVKRIVADAHPGAATGGGEDDPELLKARAKRIEEMAEAVRRAMATPTPDAKPPGN